MTRPLPETCTFREFADLVPCRPSWVTELRKTGRLVLSDDNKRVRVLESLQRIEDTRDPSKAGVSARHAAERAAAAQPAQAEPEAPHAPGQAAVAPIPIDRAGKGYQEARAVKERYLAMTAKRDYEISMGKLIDAGQVESAAAAAITVMRQRLEGMPAILAPQIAAISDEPRIRAVITEAIEHTLAELAREFGAIAKTPKAAAA